MSKPIEYGDGDQYPVITLEAYIDGAARDLTGAAVEFEVRSEDGTLLATRPGRILDPKADGKAECLFAGRETDAEGAGGTILVTPVLWVPMLGDEAAATLLANGGFDTYSGSSPTQLATGWSVVGSQSDETFTVTNLGPRPATLFEGGYVQSVAVGPSTTVTYLEQQIVHSLAVGDYVSMGCWVRSAQADVASAAASDDWSVGMAFTDAADDTYTRCALPCSDWAFVRVEHQMENATSVIKARLRYLGQPSATALYDEAYVFVGRYGKFMGRTQRIKLGARLRPSKGTNLLAGIGGFEVDSDGDGIPDGWVVGAQGSSTSGVYTEGSITYRTYAGSYSGVAVSAGERSLAIGGTGGASNGLFHTERGNFQAGETWRLSVMAQGSATAAGALRLQAREYQNTGAIQQAASAALPSTLVSEWTEHHVDLTLTEDVDALECQIWLDGADTCAYWLDEAKLLRT